MTRTLVLSTLIASACSGQSAGEAPRDPYAQAMPCLSRLLLPVEPDADPWWQWGRAQRLAGFEAHVKMTKQDCQRSGPLKDWRDEQGRPCGADLVSVPSRLLSTNEARAMGELAVRELGPELALIDLEAVTRSLQSGRPMSLDRPGRVARAAPAVVLEHILREVRPEELRELRSWSREPEAILGLLIDILSERPDLWEPRLTRFAESFLDGRRPLARSLARHLLELRPEPPGG